MTVDIVGLEAPASTAPAAPTLLERIAGGSWGCLSAGHEAGHARDDLRIDIQRLAFEELGERAVGNASTNVHGLELFVGERPDATSRFNWGQRCKERVDRVCTLDAGRLWRRWGLAAPSSSTAASTCATESTITTAESTTITTESAAITAAESATTATESATITAEPAATPATKSAAGARPRRAAPAPLATRATRLPLADAAALLR